ncbi:MAG: site-specific DNA-methyltransferase [Rikenellaceae bacterium]
MPTLHWIGKEKVIHHHHDVPFKVLEHAYGFRSSDAEDKSETKSGNKIIHGDNLEALKALLPEYEGRVKCIYIDPPYNTGNESWVYNDNVNDPTIKKWLGEVVGVQGKDFCRHDKWLCMMYPRLRLLEKLLHEDGVIAISIGHQEVAALNQLCKEMFSNKQISTVTVQTSGGKPSSGFNLLHEYIVFVVPSDFKPNPMLTTGGKSRSPFEGLTLSTFDKTTRSNQVYPIYINKIDGNFHSLGTSLQDKVKSGEYVGDLVDYSYDYDNMPEGTEVVWPVTSKGKDCVWRLIPSRFKQDFAKGYIKISRNVSKTAKNKFSVQYLPKGVIDKIASKELEVVGVEKQNNTLIFGENKTVGSDIPSIWLDKSFFTVKGTALLKEIFSSEVTKIFNYPKPVELVSEVFRAISSKDDIILDSFAGSGTSAHAVMAVNKEDEGNRKFILVEMMDYAETITAERVRRVANGYGEVDGLGGEFDYYELGESMFNKEKNLNEVVGEDKIREYIYYTETKQYLSRVQNKESKYLLDTYNDTGYYFYYEKNSLTTLGYETLDIVTERADQYIIYADRCTIDERDLATKGIIFKKIPRDIKRF